MRMNPRLCIVFALSVLVLCSPPIRRLQSTAAASSKTFSQDEKGLEKQFEPLVKAWGKHDTPAIDETGKIFALPEPNAWFGKYFAKDQVQQLVWDDEAEVNNFKTVTPGLMNLLAKGQKFHVKVTRPNASSPTKLAPRADAVMPIAPVPVEQYTVAFVSEKGMSFSGLFNFVYVDGAYRYVGKGAYPFWSMPDATRKN